MFHMLLQFYSKFLHLPKSSQSQAQTPNAQVPVSFPGARFSASQVLTPFHHTKPKSETGLQSGQNSVLGIPRPILSKKMRNKK